MIKFKNVSFSYNNHFNILNNLNFEIQNGEKLAFCGENIYDSKKIFFKLILGQEKGSGNILINDIDNTNLDFSKDISIGYISTDFVFFSTKNVYSNLKYVLDVRKINEYIVLDSIIEKFNIQYLKNEKIKNLSKYEKILVSLCRLNIRKLDILLIENIFEDLTEIQIQDLTNKIKILFDENDNLTAIIETDNQKVIDSLNLQKLHINYGSIEK